jgi:hypothetical protein
VGGGGQAEQDHASPWVPEPWDGTAPVLFVGIRRLFLTGDFLAPFDEAWAVPAGGYLLFELRECRETLLLSDRPVQAP